MNARKLLALLLAVLLLVALSACDDVDDITDALTGQNSSEPDDSDTPDDLPEPDGDDHAGQDAEDPVDRYQPDDAETAAEGDFPDDGETYEEGGDYGYLGDVMHTYFFDFLVSDAYTCGAYGTYTPAEGNQVLVVDLSVKNSMLSTIPMYDTDFQVQWTPPDGENEDDAYAWPITTIDPDYVIDHQAHADEALDENQLPYEYELGINESRQGLLFFEVPADVKDFSFAFQEYFDNDSTGDSYFLYFSAQRQDAE